MRAKHDRFSLKSWTKSSQLARHGLRDADIVIRPQLDGFAARSSIKLVFKHWFSQGFVALVFLLQGL